MRNSLVVLALVTLPLLPASAEAQQVVTYARLGYGSVFADSTRRAPAIGFGIRAEGEAFGIDVSAMNLTLKADLQETLTDVAGGSLLKLEVLRFLRPGASRSAYVGGGLSWGAVSVGRGTQHGTGSGATSWHGSGLQGEVTAGYELARGSAMRVFVQADASMPFFRATSQTYAMGRGIVTTTADEHRLIPSAVVSIGMGWSRRRP